MSDIGDEKQPQANTTVKKRKRSVKVDFYDNDEIVSFMKNSVCNGLKSDDQCFVMLDVANDISMKKLFLQFCSKHLYFADENSAKHLRCFTSKFRTALANYKTDLYNYFLRKVNLHHTLLKTCERLCSKHFLICKTEISPIMKIKIGLIVSYC